MSLIPALVQELLKIFVEVGPKALPGGIGSRLRLLPFPENNGILSP